MGKKLIYTLMCTLVFSFSAFAQETTGGIQGTVKDPSGAVVSGATVTLSSPALIGKKTATTDSAGNYHIEQLPPGVYSVTTSAPGFSPETQQNLRIETGALPNINFSLKVGQAEQTVEVNAEAEFVDVTQSKVQTNITRDVLSEIPKGRSFQSVIPFAPGARQEPLQGGRGDRTNGFQIDGASDSENVYMIDGVNNTNIQNGGVGSNFKDDFVQEVQIKSSSFEAEFGGALGGVINAVPKRGSNQWHGELKTYFQTSGLDANDTCASGFTSSNGGNVNMTTNGGSVVCGQRTNPTLAPLNTTTRLDGVPEYFVPKKDDRHVIEPGYEIGGPILTDRLNFFSSYVPTIDTTRRTVNFTGKNPGPRTLSNSFVQHSAYNRLDYRLSNSVRLFGSWNYGYSRTTGQLIAPDSAYGQVNTSATTDPSTLRSDAGFVNPLSLYSFGGDWTPTSKLVVQSRFGYFFYNNESRGTPTGIRDIYDNTLVATNGKYADASTQTLAPFDKNDPNANPCSRTVDQSHCIGDIDKTAVNTVGFANMPSNFATQFDAFKRKSTNTDVSYFLGNLFGSHTFKTGYFWQSQANEVLSTANTAVVDLDWGVKYSPVTSTTACAGIQASNSQGLCQGTYGFFFVGSNTVSNTGKVNATDQAFYLQDAWTVGRTGLTLNLGIRMDQEHNPAFDPKRFPDLNFGWGDKIAPRLGGAYDLLHNGKVKIYASYGKFFDIMKLGLTRGSFGSDYWHQCVYALDTTNFQSIAPTLTTGAGCPASGPAPGVTNGFRFIENVDFRATKADPRDPAIQANMKPVQNHEVVAGVDWAISPTMSLETRYSRKRLDNTIEDMSITDNLGFYIGNPGTTFADVLHRPVSLDQNAPLVGPFCAECPGPVKAIRDYDGLEFRLTKQAGSRWFGTVSYTYSRLQGNYAGLTNTDPTDGNGGRHAPNNGRAFDLPSMLYDPSGKVDDGPLATDRPHTGKVYGYYRLPWLGQETSIGFGQSFYEGTPISACLPVVGTSSACQWVGGRGNMPILSRDAATGNIVQTGMQNDSRTPPYLQTDFQLTHEIKVSKTHENYRLRLGGNVSNLFNQRAPTAYYEFVTPTNLVFPGRAPRFTGDPGVDWGLVMNGYNYIDAVNATGKFAGNVPGTTTAIQQPLTLASRYGQPQVFQTARQIRLEARFTF
jgi:carboxypeptidase family protein/TonB-dependent receptor-like protein